MLVTCSIGSLLTCLICLMYSSGGGGGGGGGGGDLEVLNDRSYRI